MSISEPFIRRPVATSLLMIGLMLAGVLAFRQLPVSALPQVDYPTIVVSTGLPGASPDTMASAVTTPLERQFGQIPGLNQMTSISSFASSQITLQFNLDQDIDAAQQDVQAAINATSNLLPRTLPAPPAYSKSNPADAPILTLSISSDTLPLPQVHDYTDSVLAQKIAQVSGVGLVTLNGGQKPAVRVQVDPEALAGRGLTLEDVRTALVQANVNQPKGNLEGARQSYTLAVDDQLLVSSAYRPIIIAYKDGAPVRLADVADVVDGVENNQLAGWANHQRAVILNVQRQPGANVIEVADRIKELLPRLQTALPSGIEVAVVSDRTQTVRASIDDVLFTLALTVALVVAVIFLSLRTLRATIIPGVAVPLALIATFGVMYLLGYSLNNLTLMALTIATGFVVDDAIVMLENIMRHIEDGERPFDAALKGAKQIGFTIVSLTVSLVAVMIPLLFMGGIIGRLFREFAVTLSVAIGMSAVLSLTLTAMMSAHILRPVDESRQGAFARALEAGFTRLVGFYERGLRWALDHQRTMLSLTVLTALVTVTLAVFIPKGFFPLQDTGLVIGVSEAALDTSFPRMMDRQRALSEAILADPDVQSVASFIGADGTNPTPNSGRLSITLKPRRQRAAMNEVVARLQARVRDVQGISLFLQAVQDLQIDNRVSRTQFQYTLEDADPEELGVWGPRMLDKLRTLPGLRDVATDQQSTGLSLALTIDRDSAARLGVSLQAIDDTLYDAFGQRQVTTIFTQLNLYRVILEAKPAYQDHPEALDKLYVRSSAGDPVPLSALARHAPAQAPLVIAHQGQFPAVTLSFNLAPGTSLGDAVEAIRRAEHEIGLPPGVHADFQGAARAFRESLASEPALIVAALLTVYIVLGVLYESYIHPVTIISSLASAGLGALAGLLVCRTDFSLVALIGVILLIGIVQKNAIMMIDFALDAEREQGLSPREAITRACLLRFRPIMMTTLAALLGGIPLAVGQGTGSELRRPLGISIVGGLLVSQVLTLYTTPVIYLYMDRLRAWLVGLRREKQPGAVAP
ncbi:MAG: multidrug efflux RND transporter permease subunit [Bacteroidota bacterium]